MRARDGLTTFVITTIIPSVLTKLERELKQTKPFASREEEVYLGILFTAERLSWGVSEVLRQADLTPTQYNALRILRGAHPEGLSCNEIGERMVTKYTDVTRLMNRLEARGLITRERDERDQRFLVTRITKDGLALLAELDKPVAECHRRQLGHLGERQLASLRRLLDAALVLPE